MIARIALLLVTLFSLSTLACSTAATPTPTLAPAAPPTRLKVLSTVSPITSLVESISMARTKQKHTQQRDNVAGEGEEATGGIFLTKEDIQLIYKALRYYTPGTDLSPEQVAMLSQLRRE